MQILRGEIRSDVSAVPPYRAVLHQAVLEKHLLPGANVLSRENRSAIERHRSLGNRRRIAVAFEREPDQDRKATQHDDRH